MLVSSAAPMVIGLAKSYGATALGPATLNMFFAAHVAHLKASEVAIIAQTGQVLDGVTAGYGIGYMASTAVIAAGQLMLGNTLDAAVTVGSAAVFANPTAATCAAIGALFYGFHALSEDERSLYLARLQEGLGIGVELIRSLISFVEARLTKLVDSDTLRSLRALVGEYAAMFGRSIADITKSVSDRAILIAHHATSLAYEAAATVGSSIYAGAAAAGEYGGAVGSTLQSASSGSGRWLSEASRQARDRLIELFDHDRDKKQ